MNKDQKNLNIRPIIVVILILAAIGFYKNYDFGPDNISNSNDEIENVVENTLTKNGKPLLKVSALRSLYLGKNYWYDLEDQLGTADKEYRLGTSGYSSYVYYNSALDDYSAEPKHIEVEVSPLGIITEISSID
jgi:hypothetical protein